MKRDYLPFWLQRVLFIGLAFIFTLLPLHAFISTWGGTAIGPLWLWKSWKEILVVLLALPLIWWLSVKPQRWAVLTRDWLFWLLVGFIVLTALLGLIYLPTNGAQAFMAGLAMDTRYLSIFCLAYALFRFGKFDWPVLRRKASLFLIAVGVGLAILGMLQVWLLPADFLSQFGYNKESTIAPYILIDENPDALRAFATLRGPNDFGAYLLLPLVLSLLFTIRNKWFLAGSFAIVIGLVVSGSRSAWIAAVVTVAGLAALQFGRNLFRSRIAIGALIGSVAVVVLLGLAAVSVPALRLAIFHSSPGDSSLTEGSTDVHWQATMDGVSRVAAQPLGCGPGCAGPASYYSDEPKISENYYVQIAEETGVIGLGLWVAIVGTVAWRLWRLSKDWLAQGLLASFIGLTAIGFWLHVWGDDPLSLTWWALAGMVLGYYAGTSQKKSLS